MRWEVFAGPVANQKRDGRWQALEVSDRITFRNVAGDYFEVWLDADELNVRSSGSNSRMLSVRPVVANGVRLRMIRTSE